MVLTEKLAVEGSKASLNASRALTGDVYTRKWTTTKIVGKGKKKRSVTTEHEIRANPISVGLGLIAIAGAGLLTAATLWATQQKLRPQDKWVYLDFVILQKGKYFYAIKYPGGTRPLATGTSKDEVYRKMTAKGWEEASTKIDQMTPEQVQAVNVALSTFPVFGSPMMNYLKPWG